MSYKYDNYREDIMPFIPEKSKTILDIGCGTGKLISLLENKGKICWGIEPSITASNIAKKSLKNGNVINSKIENAMALLPENYFDTILLLDVLEHLIEPLEVLSQLKCKLSNDGVIVSSIPNIRYFHSLMKLLINKEFKYTDSGIMDRTHLRFFTYKSMKELFTDAGYDVLLQEGINPTPSKKFKILNFLCLGKIWDCRYLQFVTLAKPKGR
jgi:2-polyprenyl-3-methyl-5-hydroxy-6-metoxy-1,4-benzoquinol methylase